MGSPRPARWHDLQPGGRGSARRVAPSAKSRCAGAPVSCTWPLQASLAEGAVGRILVGDGRYSKLSIAAATAIAVIVPPISSSAARPVNSFSRLRTTAGRRRTGVYLRHSRTDRPQPPVSLHPRERPVRSRGNFPRPAAGNVRSPLCHWADVAAWFEDQGADTARYASRSPIDGTPIGSCALSCAFPAIDSRRRQTAHCTSLDPQKALPKPGTLAWSTRPNRRAMI
jgi:hypothetical protein